MTTTDYLLDKFNLTVIPDIELPGFLDAIIVSNHIYIKPGMSEKKKFCTIAEEIAHKRYTSGHILKEKSVSKNKQEILAKRKTFDYLIPFSGLIECNNLGMTNFYEVADYLNVTEDFLRAGIEYYKEKYGIMYFEKETRTYFYLGNTIQIFKEDDSKLFFEDS